MKLKDISPQVLDSLFSKLLTEGCYRKFYKLKDPNYDFGEMKNYKNAEIKNIYRAKSGHNLTRETAENLTNLLGVKFDDVFVDNTTKKGLAKNTVQNVKMTISAIFTTAVKKEILRRNPVFLTESLAVDNTIRHEDYLTPEQAKKLLEYLENQDDFQYRVLLTFLLLTGCRIGEALGLKWDSIDFETGTIYIRQTLADTRKTGGRFVLQTPKTKNSERYILIPQTLVQLLKTFKEKQILNIHNIVFTNSVGDFYNSHVLNSKFKRTCKLLGFSQKLRIHSIRHSTASLMINADIGVKQIAEQLGHKSTNVTENIYSHIFQSSKIKTMQAIELSLLNDENKK
jgi:integrase